MAWVGGMCPVVLWATLVSGTGPQLHWETEDAGFSYRAVPGGGGGGGLASGCTVTEGSADNRAQAVLGTEDKEEFLQGLCSALHLPPAGL